MSLVQGPVEKKRPCVSPVCVTSNKPNLSAFVQLMSQEKVRRRYYESKGYLMRKQARAMRKKMRTCELVFNHNLSEKEKSYLTVVVQDAFDESCAGMIESAIEGNFCRGNGDAKLHTMTARVKGSAFSLSGGVLYRSYNLDDATLVYEVLFLAVRPCAKRRNVASHMVDELVCRLKHDSTATSKYLCVSIKTSSEAKSFWSDMSPVEPTEPLWAAMIKFDDFDPVCKEIE